MPDWLLRACREIARPDQFAEGAGRFVRLAGRSREHVARSMQQYLGISPTRFVNRVRMHHAARQLEMSNRGIVEIAGECGLENLGHFHALFRAEFGMTPRDWRQAHRRMP
jgi:AraC family cel operon transcriptional repressor